MLDASLGELLSLSLPLLCTPNEPLGATAVTRNYTNHSTTLLLVLLCNKATECVYRYVVLQLASFSEDLELESSTACCNTITQLNMCIEYCNTNSQLKTRKHTRSQCSLFQLSVTVMNSSSISVDKAFRCTLQGCFVCAFASSAHLLPTTLSFHCDLPSTWPPPPARF